MPSQEINLSVTELSHMVMKSMGQDNARKQRIFARSPHLTYALDAAGMSAAELATRELKELGINAGANDPEALLDAHHAGREWARGMKGGEAAAGRLIGGSAQDSAGDSAIERYIRGEA